MTIKKRYIKKKVIFETLINLVVDFSHIAFNGIIQFYVTKPYVDSKIIKMFNADPLRLSIEHRLL